MANFIKSVQTLRDFPAIGIVAVYADTAPANGTRGYAPGCQWTNILGANGNIWFVNDGSFNSANWSALA